MARKPHPTPEVSVDSTSPIPEGHSLIQTSEAELNAIEQDQFGMAMQDIGAMRAFDFLDKMSSRAQVEIYLRLKKTKAYLSVPNGAAGHFSSLDEFCEAYLGESGRNIRRKADNYHLLGAELYETSERLGFKGKDYTALKALPAEDQDVIKQAMQADDRDQVIDLLQEMAARHASEKAGLTAKATEAEETARARSEVIASKEAKINSLEEANSKLKRRIATATPDEVGEQLRTETTGIGWTVVGTLNDDLNRAFEALDEHARANDCTHEEFMSGVLFDIQRAIWAIRERFAVKERPDGDARPDWVKDERPTDQIVQDALGPQIAEFKKRMGEAA